MPPARSTLLIVTSACLLALEASAQTNTPPRLVKNQPVVVYAGQTTIITAENLLTTDVETVDPAEIIYTLWPDDPTANVPEGGLYLGNNVLKSGSQFSQADINNQVVLWQAPAVVHDSGFGIPFTVRDFDGALAADGAHTSFDIRIVYSNTPPVALDGQLIAPLGTSIAGRLLATNAELYQPITFRLAAQAKKGTVTMTDTNTGDYVFKANIGATGDDYFTFQAFDGVASALTPGIMHVIITNTVPVVAAQSFEARQDGHVEGVVKASDIDLPAQPLTFTLVAPPLRGHLESFDPATGHFLYRPDAGRFGYDYFVVSANDGSAESAYQVISLPIRPVLMNGSILVVGKEGPAPGHTNGFGAIYAINSANGDTFRMVVDDVLRDMLCILYDPHTEELLFGGGGNGAAFVGSMELSGENLRPFIFDKTGKYFPISLSFDHQNQILVGAGPAGVVRVDPVTGTVTSVSAGGLLKTTTAVWEEPEGRLLVLDAVNLFDDAAKVVEVDPVLGTQTELFPTNILLDPTDFLVENTNQLLVIGRGGLFELNRSANTLVQLLPESTFTQLGKSIVEDPNGGLLMVDLQSRLLRITLPGTNVTAVPTELTGMSPVHATVFHQPATLGEWRTNYFFADIGDPSKEATVWGDAADPDGDGAPNLFEYAFGLNPLKADSRRPMAFTTGMVAGKPYALISYPVRKAYGESHYAVQVSGDLVHWSTDGFEPQSVERLGDLFESHTVGYPVVSDGPSTPRFFRLALLP